MRLRRSEVAFDVGRLHIPIWRSLRDCGMVDARYGFMTDGDGDVEADGSGAAPICPDGS